MDISEQHQGCMIARELAQREGVTHPENLPYMISPEGATTAVLLVHGFTASPFEMRLLADHLAKARIASMAVRLPGHGTTPEDLAGRTWQEWLDVTERGFRSLQKEYDQVYGAGMSTGCLLLLALTLSQNLSGLLLFSPYLRILHKLSAHAFWLRFLRPFHTTSPAEESPHYYRRRPVAGVHQINRLIQRLTPDLSRVTAPVLAFNGDGDETVQVQSGRQLVDLLGSSVKIYQRLGKDVSHVMTREGNPHRIAMFDLAVDFIQELDAAEVR